MRRKNEKPTSKKNTKHRANLDGCFEEEGKSQNPKAQRIPEVLRGKYYPFALHAPSHRTWLADYGLAEKDVLCAIMMIIAGGDWDSLRGILGFFSFWLSTI